MGLVLGRLAAGGSQQLFEHAAEFAHFQRHSGHHAVVVQPGFVDVVALFLGNQQDGRNVLRAFQGREAIEGG